MSNEYSIAQHFKVSETSTLPQTSPQKSMYVQNRVKVKGDDVFLFGWCIAGDFLEQQQLVTNTALQSFLRAGNDS